ncbi:MAG TPA: periplasmic heavy metal sensor [Acidobacteriota bacterium]|nr:periplasmic heavy metal sensor [Acidobacteriota bacterium]
MRTREWRTIVGAAALAFLAAVVIPAVAAAQEGQTPPPAKERPARMLAREALGLTPEQEKALTEFRKTRERERIAFRDEMARIRSERRELVRDPRANQAKLEALIDRAAKLRAEREKAGLRSRIERDKIFTPEQLEKMKAFRERLGDRAGRLAFRRPGRLLGPGFRGERLARLRALRHRPLIRRWRDR